VIRRLSLRWRLVALVTFGAVVTLAGLTLAFNVLLRSSLDADANRLLEGRAQTALETIAFRHGEVRVIEDSDVSVTDAQVWVFAGGRTLERPRAQPQVQSLARSLIGTDRRYAEDAATDTRLYSLAVRHRGRPVGTVISGISLDPYERTAHRALVGSLILAGVLLLLIVAGVRLVVGSALRPVARMTADAAEWSETDLDHRFHAAEPHDELSALAATFDGMLDRLAESLRHEQRFTAEVSHELRTPLAAIITEAELALRRERGSDEYRSALSAIADRARQLQRIVEALLAAARAETATQTERSDPVEVVGRVLDEQRSREQTGRELLLEQGPAPPGAALATDRDMAERILAPLVENASAHAATRVLVSIEPEGEGLRIVVSDDGPGVPLAERERIFEPGYRASGASDGGAGLGLALSRRLARAVGGEVEACPGEAPGGCFVVRLPAA
jgi:signal transduction histidine kinase